MPIRRSAWPSSRQALSPWPPTARSTVAPGEAYNAKVGQRIGNTTIREIQRDRVVVDVEEFGLTDRRIMFIASRRQGGTQ